MSAVAQSIGYSENSSFSAHLALDSGVSVNIHAPTLPELAAVVAKLQPAANDAKAPARAASPKSSPAPTPPAGNAPAPTSAPATARPAASGSASSDDGPHFNYDDVKARVLKLAKISRETAEAALKKFGVDHGNKLKLEQYPEFIAHADHVLLEKASA